MTTKTSEQLGLEALMTELSGTVQNVKVLEKKLEDQYKELHAGFDGVKSDSADLTKKLEDQTKAYADTLAQLQAANEAITTIKQQLDAPAHRAQTDKELDDLDRKAALDFQRQIHEFGGRDLSDFKEDPENLVDVKAYRSAARKLVSRVGDVDFNTREKATRDFSKEEKAAFENANLSTGFFSPQLLGLEVDCNLEPGSLLDLYGSVTLNAAKSQFLYPKIDNYGDLGEYGCETVCDAPPGEEGQIRWLNGRVFDFRGVFCFQRKVLQESNIDLLSFMIRAAQRSHRINRNNALITGDNINTPMGWLTASDVSGQGFPKRQTAEAGKFDHRDFRVFLSTHPVEARNPTAVVLHQNVFALLAAKTDSTGRFIFGDGDLTFSPTSVRERIRIANVLPDATEDLTKGGVGQSDLASGAFLAAQADWSTAYYAVNKRPIWFEQYIGGSTAWCVKYQFGAEDGGFLGCGNAGQILIVQ